MIPGMDEICQRCGVIITRRAKANVWNGDTVVCTKCLRELETDARRMDAAYGIAGKPHSAWMVHDGRSQHGPYTTAELIELLEWGRVGWDWQIWRDGMRAWSQPMRLFTLPELSNGKIELRDFGQGDGTYHPPR
jgi:hypothetical protein